MEKTNTFRLKLKKNIEVSGTNIKWGKNARPKYSKYSATFGHAKPL